MERDEVAGAIILRMLREAPYGQAADNAPACRAARLYLEGDFNGAAVALEPPVESVMQQRKEP